MMLNVHISLFDLNTSIAYILIENGAKFQLNSPHPYYNEDSDHTHKVKYINSSMAISQCKYIRWYY